MLCFTDKIGTGFINSMSSLAVYFSRPTFTIGIPNGHSDGHTDLGDATALD